MANMRDELRDALDVIAGLRNELGKAQDTIIDLQVGARGLLQQRDELSERVDWLQKYSDALVGETFGDRVHAALRDRARVAEKQRDDAVNELRAMRDAAHTALHGDMSDLSELLHSEWMP